MDLRRVWSQPRSYKEVEEVESTMGTNPWYTFRKFTYDSGALLTYEEPVTTCKGEKR